MPIGTAQFISLHSQTSRPCALVAGESGKALVDCPPCTQRQANDFRIRLSRVTHIFLTRAHDEVAGGTFGLILHLAETGSKCVTIVGPAGTKAWFGRNYRCFLTWCRMKIDVVEVLDNDANESATSPNDGKDTASEPGHMKRFTRQPKASFKVNDFTVHVWTTSISPVKKDVVVADHSAGSKRLFEELSANSNGTQGAASGSEEQAWRIGSCHPSGIESYCSFTIEMDKHPGKFKVDIAKQLGVKPGPDFARLKSGESVTASDGSTVHPSQVVAESEDAEKVSFLASFGISEDPALAGQASPLFSTQKFRVEVARQQQAALVDDGSRHTMIHFAQPSSWKEYLCNQINPKLVNHVASKGAGTLFQWSAQHNARRMLWKNAFPALDPDATAVSHDISISQSSNQGGHQSRSTQSTSAAADAVRFVSSGDIFQCSPQSRVGWRGRESKASSSSLPIFKDQLKAQILEDLPHLKSAADGTYVEFPSDADDVASSQQLADEWSGKVSGSNVKEWDILFLGTGSATPSQHRNPSGILVRLCSCVILLDCGEAIGFQLNRVFGRRADDVIRNISLIWLSHKHADHIAGLPLLGYHMFNRLNKVPLILSPGRLQDWICTCACDFGFQVDFVAAADAYPENSSSFQCERIAKMTQLAGLGGIQTTPVEHSCRDCWGLKLTGTNGASVVYSGDCIPCETLIELGKGCNVCIHEATFESGREEIAALKKHCTIDQALGICAKMQAGVSILTHFSQRYSKMPVVPEGVDAEKVFFAFDVMRVFPGLKAPKNVVEDFETLFNSEDGTDQQ